MVMAMVVVMVMAEKVVLGGWLVRYLGGSGVNCMICDVWRLAIGTQGVTMGNPPAALGNGGFVSRMRGMEGEAIGRKSLDRWSGMD
jgi:hypothetical protein